MARKADHSRLKREREQRKSERGASQAKNGDVIAGGKRSRSMSRPWCAIPEAKKGEREGGDQAEVGDHRHTG